MATVILFRDEKKYIINDFIYLFAQMKVFSDYVNMSVIIMKSLWKFVECGGVLLWLVKIRFPAHASAHDSPVGERDRHVIAASSRYFPMAKSDRSWPDLASLKLTPVDNTSRFQGIKKYVVLSET